MNQVEQFESLISLLLDEDLEAVGTMIRDEKRRRAKVLIDAKRTPPLTEEEMALISEGKTVRAALDYNDRTGLGIDVSVLVVYEHK